MKKKPLPGQLDLFVPDRFDMLQDRAKSELKNIVIPVEAALARINSIHADMRAAGRGGFLIFRGISGCGKSTILNTLNLFLEDVEIISLSSEANIEHSLRSMPATSAKLRVVIIEGRDALRDISAVVLETAIHEVNAFIRTTRGIRTLIVWPVNAEDLEQSLINISRRVGGDSLLGVGETSFRFNGPSKDQYLEIANRTIATLNQGASLLDLGVSETQIPTLIDQSSTIGYFLGLLRREMIRNKSDIEGLIKKEKCKLWIIVVAANDPEGDIAGLTRGTTSSIDIERLMRATNANVVEELKKFPQKLGILGAVLDAKIIHFPTLSALSVTRTYADKKLKLIMSQKALSSSGKKDGQSRIKDSDLGRAFSGNTMVTRTRGSKSGSNTIDAFRKLAKIAATNDVVLNATIGRALQDAGLIQGYATEKDLGTGLTRRTDVTCETSIGIVRLEIMWRSKAGRAAIANYVLTKMFNYGRAIGYLE